MWIHQFCCTPYVSFDEGTVWGDWIKQPAQLATVDTFHVQGEDVTPMENFTPMQVYEIMQSAQESAITEEESDESNSQQQNQNNDEDLTTTVDPAASYHETITQDQGESTSILPSIEESQPIPEPDNHVPTQGSTSTTELLHQLQL